jgi:hypothetical protein
MQFLGPQFGLQRGGPPRKKFGRMRSEDTVESAGFGSWCCDVRRAQRHSPISTRERLGEAEVQIAKTFKLCIGTAEVRSAVLDKQIRKQCPFNMLISCVISSEYSQLSYMSREDVLPGHTQLVNYNP